MAVAILLFVSLYMAIGGLFGLLFIWRGVERIDSAARGTPWAFRFLILPGVVALWPTMALRWRRALRSRGES